MKTKQSNKMQASFSKTILLFGCLFAVINLYGQSAQGYSPGAAVAATTDNAGNGYCRHELSVWAAGGVSSLLYSPDAIGDRSFFQLGGAAGLGYTYYFSRHFGVLLGAELALYNSKITIDNLEDSYFTSDPTDGRPIDYISQLRNYEEKQRLLNVNIPLMLQYQTNGTNKFFVSAGFKLGISVDGKYQIADATQLRTYGYYHDINQYMYDIDYLGYGNYTGSGKKEKVDFNLAYMAALEAGMKWHLSQRLSLYTGVYGEYGFNDLMSQHNENFVSYSPTSPTNIQINSALTSQYNKANGGTTEITGKVHPLAFGIKLRLGINLCKGASSGETSGQQTTKVTPPPPPVGSQGGQPVPPPPPVGPQGGQPIPPIGPGPQGPVRQVPSEWGEEPSWTRLPDEEINEDLRRAVLEYGSGVRGTINVELDGFDLDQSILKPKMQSMLDQKIVELRRFGPNVFIIAEGHTCDLGSDEHNMQLGQRRAEAVRDYLIKNGGVRPENITAVSKGKADPLVPNTNEANRRANRRVVLIVRDK